MNTVRKLLKDFLSLSLTVNELFLAIILWAIGFSNILAVPIVCLIPLYICIKVIFRSSECTQGNKFFLAVLGTVWIITVMSLGTIHMATRLGSVDSFSNFNLEDYIIAIYLCINISRIVLLFFFSGYLKINKFQVVHVKVPHIVLIAIVSYSAYRLFHVSVAIGELPLNTALNQLSAVVTVFITGSFLLQIFQYIFFKPKRS